jgi:predicted nucleotidyltransferase
VTEDIAGPLGDYFRNREEILLAFMFGSAVSERLTEKSDLDIAVLFNSTPDFSLLVTIRDEISECMGREIDLVVLNDASPVIRMQVLKNGKLLKSEDTVIYSNFFVKTVKEYDDLKYIRKEAEENILRGRIYA